MTPRRTAEVEVDGFGPVTVRALTRGQWKRIRATHPEPNWRMAAVVRAGLVRPRFSDEVVDRLSPAAFLAVGLAVVDVSFPHVPIRDLLPADLYDAALAQAEAA